MDSKVLLISNCRFAFLTWTMSLWLRLKRGLFLKRRRCSSDYSIVYFSYTIIPRFFMLNLPCLSRTCLFFPNSTPACCSFFLWETLRPSGINAFPPPSAFTSSKSWCSPPLLPRPHHFILFYFYPWVQYASCCIIQSQDIRPPDRIGFGSHRYSLLLSCYRSCLLGVLELQACWLLRSTILPVQGTQEEPVGPRARQLD